MADDRHSQELRPYRFQAQPGEPVLDECGGGGTSERTGAAIAESGEFLNVGREEIRRRRLNGGGGEDMAISNNRKTTSPASVVCAAGRFSGAHVRLNRDKK